MLKIPDDSGFLALIDPAAYSGFVDEDWELQQLYNHFRAEMKRHTMIIWGTGLEGTWNVDVTLKKSRVRPYREITAPLVVTGGKLLVTNFESLTKAARSPDVRLPQQHETRQLVAVPNGQYSCRVIQFFDPKQERQEQSAEPAEFVIPDFVLELTRARTLPRAPRGIPWRVKE